VWSRIAVVPVLLLALGALPSHHSSTQGAVAAPRVTCEKAPRLGRGSAVPGGDLQTVDFMSATVGVGLTASAMACTSPKGQTRTVPWPVRLALSTDAGHTWAIEGALGPPGSRPGTWPAPPGQSPMPTNGFASPAVLAFTSPRVGWAEVDGVLSRTADGGLSWQRANLGAPVAALADAGGSILAVTWGTWQLWRADSVSAAWQLVSAIPVAAKTTAAYIALGPGPEEALVGTSRYGDAPLVLAETDNAGKRWARVADPCAVHAWLAATALAESPGGTMAVLCLGGAAAGSADHGFYVSGDRGLSWSERAAVTDLANIGHSGLPLQDTAEVLAAPTAERFYIETENEFSVSVDGGRHWRPVSGVGHGNGLFGIDFVGPGDGWAFAGGSLLATPDGLDWAPA